MRMGVGVGRVAGPLREEGHDWWAWQGMGVPRCMLCKGCRLVLACGCRLVGVVHGM